MALGKRRTQFTNEIIATFLKLSKIVIVTELYNY